MTSNPKTAKVLVDRFQSLASFKWQDLAEPQRMAAKAMEPKLGWLILPLAAVTLPLLLAL